MQSSYQATELPLVETRSPRIKWAYDYWCARRGERPMPSRSDLHPEEMKPILGRTMIVRVSYRPLTLRYSLFGTEIAGHYGRDMTGRTVRDLVPEGFADMILGLYQQAIDLQAPSIHSLTSTVSDRTNNFERLALPLSSNGSDIDQFFTITEYRKQNKQRLAEESGAPFDL